MEFNTDRNTRIDVIRKRYGISLEAVAKYNSLNRDEIRNSCEIFNLNDANKIKTLALLYMLCEDENDGVIQKFRTDSGLNDENYNSSLLVSQYATMLTTALIYNPNLYAMALNFYGIIKSGFSASKIKLYSVNKENKTNIIPFPVNYRAIFAAAAVFVVILFIAILVKLNGGLGQRLNNEWIAGLMEPNKGQDGIAFVSNGNEGARIGIRSPLTGTAMAANDKKTNTTVTLAYYNKAIKTEKNNAALYVNRGIAYTLQGYVDSAITDFNKAIELEPDNSCAYFNRAAAYMGKADADSAIADLMTVISINSYDSEAYYALGVLYFRQYENDDAKPKNLLEKSLDAFSRSKGFKDADFISDYISRLL